MSKPKRTSFYAVALAALLVSCGQKSEIKVYRVSKAPLEEETAAQQNMMPTNAPSPGVPSGMTANAPTGVATPSNWTPQPLSQMRQASFLVKGDNGAIADISLVSLGPSAGDVLENVNRWLAQLEQPPITETQLGKIAQRLTTSLGEVVIVDMAGLPKGADSTKDGRIIAAMISTTDSTLFFKMRGNSDLTEAQKPEFIKWVAVICDQQAQTKSSPTAELPPQPAADAPKIHWKLPEGWAEVPASAMRYASFTTSGPDDAKVDVSVVTFPGDGGPDADNLNRWRQQIGLAPVDGDAAASSIAPLKANDGAFSTTDISGPKGRTIAAWIRSQGRVWFFKATGPTDAVEKEKPKFMQFVQSVRF